MKEVVKEMLRHPFSTVIVTGALGTAIAGIISAIKGNPGKSFVDVSMTK